MILVLSDLHFGLPSSPAPESLAPLLEGVREVILNGDAAEEASARHRDAAGRAMQSFAAIAARAGAVVTRLEGNHDPGCGEPAAVRAGGAVLVTHGHAFHPAIAPWSPRADDVAAEFRRAWDAAPALAEPDRTLAAARAAAIREREHEHAAPPLEVLARMARRPWTLPLVVGYWRIFPELSARFLERAAEAAGAAGGTPPCIVVSGHSHRAGAWLVRRALVLNTGSFTFPGHPHAVRIDGDSVEFTPLVRRGAGWRQDDAGRRAWRISEVARATAAASTPVS